MHRYLIVFLKFFSSLLSRQEFILLLFATSLLVLTSCAEEVLPKPKAFLSLSYHEATYQKTTTDCPYTFEYSIDAVITNNEEKCWNNISYPRLKASLNMTYRPIENNLIELLQESEKLTYNHAIKADGISSLPFENKEKRVYGSLSQVSGNAASPLQFYVTDSSKHFITGALYFNVQPNYDSILPAVKFIEKDIKRLMETLEWND